MTPRPTRSRFALLSVLLLLGAAPAPEPPPPSGVQEAELPNGMKVLVVEDHAAPVATFSVFYRVGSRYEGAGVTGAAHLLEHMMFKGTERRGRGEIMGLLDRLGARWNATTFYDYTNYYATVPVDRLEAVVELEADRMVGSTVLDRERDLERIVVRNELERAENSPIRSLLFGLWATAFQAHPYHHPVIGWRSDVEGMPTERLRAFYKEYYQPDNAIAVVVGDFKAADALALVRKHFGPLPGGHAFTRPYTVEPPQRGDRRLTIRKPGELKVVALGWKAPAAADADTVPLKLLQLVLSGSLDLGPFGDPLDPGIGNRLHQALVEKELATVTAADFIPLKDPGLFSVLALPRPDVSLEKVEQAIRAEIERLKTTPVPAAELERAKARAAAAYGLLQDGTSGRAMLLGYFATIADWRLADQFPQRLREVTAADLQRAARKYFSDEGLTTGWFVPTTAAPAGPPQRSELGPELGPGLRLAALSDPGPSTPPSAPPAPSAAPVQGGVRRVVLPNGLVVLVRESHASPTFALAGSIAAGSALDPAGQPGLAALTAAALTRGAAGLSKLEIARRLEEVGASLSYGAGAEEVSFGARGLSRDFERVLEVLAQTLTQPSFPAAEIKKLQREAVADLRQAEDSPSTRAGRALAQGLYPRGHPYYQYPLEEEIAALQKLTPAALKAFHKARYGGDTIVLAVVGDVDADRAVEAIGKRLGSLPRTGQRWPTIAAVPLREAAAREVVFLPEKSNVDVLVGHQGPLLRTDPDYYPAMIGNFVLGGSASARLFKRVRDELGLTYGIYSSLAAGHGPGPWTMSMSLNPGNVDKALEAAKAVVERTRQEGISAPELLAAQETLVGRFKVGLATNSGMAGALASFESYGFPPDFIDRHPELIRKVTGEQVRGALQRYFHPDRALTVIAGTFPAPGEGPAKAK